MMCLHRHILVNEFHHICNSGSKTSVLETRGSSCFKCLSSPQDNDKLHLNLLELEVSGDPWASAEAVQECVTRALAAPLASHTKILFSQRGLQFAEDYSNSIERSLNIVKHVQHFH